MHITGNVTPEEEEILLNEKKLYFKMKSFDHIDLSFDAKMQVAEQDYFDLGKSIFKFCLRFREDTRAGSQERVFQWKTLQANIEKDFKEFWLRKYQEKYVGVQIGQEKISAEILNVCNTEISDNVTAEVKEDEVSQDYLTNGAPEEPDDTFGNTNIPELSVCIDKHEHEVQELVSFSSRTEPYSLLQQSIRQ